MRVNSSSTDSIAARLGQPVFTTGDEVRFNCFRRECDDSKHHLYVNLGKEKYFCQKCQMGGSLENLLKVLGIPSLEQPLSVWKKVMQDFLFGSENSVAEREQVTLDDYRTVFEGSEALRYLKSRGISQKRVYHYGLGFGVGKLRNRIIFPDYDKHGKLCYWVARTYSNHRAKYKNATASCRDQLYNLGRMIKSGDRERVVITEGPISAIIAGYDAVCTYGKFVTGTQISKLVEFGAQETIVAFDGDALNESISLASRLFRRGLKVKFIQFAATDDPASVGPVEMRRRIRTAEAWSTFPNVGGLM